MIDTTKLWDPVYNRLSAAGVYIVYVDGVLECNNPTAAQAIINAYTVQDAHADKCAEVSAYAKTLRDKVIGNISPGEMASWPIKLAEAAQYTRTGDASVAPMLSTEALARGVTLDDLVTKVGNNAQQFSMLESLIAGADGKHRDAIKLLQTVQDVIHYDYSQGWPGV